MARPKLVSPDQPLPIRLLLRLYEFSASLKLAVVLILTMAYILALGTVVEAAWGTPAAQFGVYQTWWFALCLVLLAVNIFAAAAIRYPWKRHQTGFVITHIGLLILLLGAGIGRLYGIDAQIFVYEMGADHRAYADELHFRMTRHEVDEGDAAEQAIVLHNFRPGIFSWRDYKTMFRFNQPGDLNSPEWWMWKGFRTFCGGVFAIANRSNAGDVLYDQDGVKLEVLDYLADSRQVAAPMIQVMLALPAEQRLGPDGKPIVAPTRWAPFTLSVTGAPKQPAQYPNGLGARELAGGGHLTFWLTSSKAQVEAFLKGGPQGELGEKGQVVLFVGDKRQQFLVEEKLGEGRFPLEGSDFEAELTTYWPKAEVDAAASQDGKFVWTGDPDASAPDYPAVKITLHRDGKQAGELVLFAKAPEDNIHDFKNQVFGDYWFDHKPPQQAPGQAPSIMTGGGSRIDIIQGPDEELYYRYWRRSEKQLEFARKLPSKGSAESAVEAFTMPAGQQMLYVNEYIPSKEPVAEKFLPLPFDREKNIGVRQPAALVRLTVDKQSEEFWVLAYIGPPEEPPRLESQNRTVFGKDRFVSLLMPVDSVDVGFRTRLLQFERKLDPGTSQPSHYSSTIDVLDRQRDRTVFSAKLERVRPVDLRAPTPRAASDIASASAIAYDDPREYLFWIDPLQKTIQRVKVDEGRVGEVVEGLIESGLQDPQDLVIDSSAQKMFWSDHEASPQGDVGVIRRANLDGTKVETVAQVEGVPTDLALDPRNQVIYWLDSWRGAIGRMAYDGGEINDELIAGLNTPGGIALDAERQHLYWTEVTEGVIRRASTDGSGEKIIVVREQYEKPNRLAVDSKAERLYWSDLGEGPIQHPENGPSVPERYHKIRQADLDGANVRDLLVDGVHGPGALAIDEKQQRLFWAQDAVFRRDVWITMNAPVDIADPTSGRRYRIFQEAFNGPWKPGDPQFELNVPATSDKSELYQSVLTVNHDPGRWVRNWGCLFVVLGIATMFYMRAYFFTGKRAAKESPPPPEKERSAPSSRKNRKKTVEAVS